MHCVHRPGRVSLLTLLLATPTLALAQVGAPPAFDKPVDLDTLAAYRGGSDKVRAEIGLTGTTSQNTASQISTGQNIIQSGSFANLSGLPIVVQNSGANVLIQNAVILQLQMQ
ncbi:MAG TPA: hypothetical protein VEQ09_11025 [Aquabacterium sp.]|nr:hypothetical protein [Aquabacterium sp.]